MDTVTPALTARQIFPQAFLSTWTMPVLNEETGEYLTYRQLRKHPRLASIWYTFYSNEMGLLCQGIGVEPQGVDKRVDGNNTFHVIYYNDIPTDQCKDITYKYVVCNFKPHKSDPYHTRITIGGNLICYPGDVGTNTASLELVKFFLNSVLSRPVAHFTYFDIEKNYIGTPMDRPKYVCINISNIP